MIYVMWNNLHLFPDIMTISAHFILYTLIIYIYIYDLAMETEQINNNQSNIQQPVAQTNPNNNNVTVIRHEHAFVDNS